MEPFSREDPFERLYALLQQEPKTQAKNRTRERRFLEAVYWMGDSGAQWRFLSTEYGRWNSVYKRFARWGSWASGSGCSRRWLTSPTCSA